MRLLTSTDLALRVLMRLSAAPDEHVNTDVLARELATIAADNLTQKERHLDEARRKNAVGTATDYDVLAAQAIAHSGVKWMSVGGDVMGVRNGLQRDEFDALEADLKAELAKPLDERNWQPLIAKYQALAAQKDDDAVAAAAKTDS